MSAKPPYDRCFRTLANPLRIQIITALTNRPMSVSELSDALGVERSKVSHALRTLKKCSFVGYNKKGRANIYFLTKSVLNSVKVRGNIFEVIRVHVEKHCKNKKGCNS